MAKDGKKKKVKSRSSTKYATSSDDASSSDDEDNLLTLFANLNMQQKEKLNELISAIHDKDELLDSQEDFLIKENKKHVKVKNAYALEVEKCEKLSSELSTCHDIISNLRNENTKLIAKVENLNVCDSLVSLRNDNASLITKIDKLNASLSSFKIENEKLIAKAKDLNVSAFRPRGVPGPMSKIVAACPSPDGLARDGTQRGQNAARVILRQGDALAVGVTSACEGERERE
jgi:predicted RNase H-like nuclease (RuvC/YqgF family)